MAHKIALSTDNLNFWVSKTTKTGFTIKSYYLLPFFLSHEDFKGYLVDAGKINHDGEYSFICNDDASELNNIISDYLTLKFNTEATVLWPFVDVYSEGVEAPFPSFDMYEGAQRDSVPTEEEISNY